MFEFSLSGALKYRYFLFQRWQTQDFYSSCFLDRTPTERVQRPPLQTQQILSSLWFISVNVKDFYSRYWFIFQLFYFISLYFLTELVFNVQIMEKVRHHVCFKHSEIFSLHVEWLNSQNDSFFFFFFCLESLKYFIIKLLANLFFLFVIADAAGVCHHISSNVKVLVELFAAWFVVEDCSGLEK